MESLTKQQKNNLKNDNDEIDLKEIFLVLLENWKTIFIAALIGAAFFGSYHVFFMKDSYRANAEIYITNTDSVVSFSDLQLSAALTDDYARIIRSRTVLNRVINQLELNLDYKQLRELVTVSNPDSTHIIVISVSCGDLELARNIANALLNVSIEQIYQIIGSSEPTVIDFAEAEAVENITPRLSKYIVVGGILGAGIVCGILVLSTLMNTTIKTEADIDKYLNIPTLTVVPYYREKQ